MRCTRRRSLTAAATLALGAGLLGLSPVASAAVEEPVIGQTTLGSIFVDDRTAGFDIHAGDAPVSWRVVDDQGRTVASGQLPAGDSRLELPRLELGQYTLYVAGSGGEAEEASTPFALIDSWEGDKDPRFGMNTKFGLPADEPGSAPVWNPETNEYAQGTARYQQDLIPILDQTGAGGTRDTIAWNQFEPEEKLYAGGPDWYQEYIDATTAIDAPPLVILSYGNKLYDVDQNGIGSNPFTDEGRQAFADYARAVLSRYEGKVERVEVWNEWNGYGAPWNRGPCSDPDVAPECYAELLKVTYETVKEVHPDAEVVGPAGVTLPYGFLERVFAAGGLNYLDAVTVHPYGFPAAPETGYCQASEGNCGLEQRIEQLDALVRQYNGGESMPIWFTEMGWGSYEPEPGSPWQARRGVSEATQADYLVRSHVISYASGVDELYWYSLRNDKTLPTGPGANWGLVRNAGDPLGSYAPKESFSAYTTMTRQLSGAEFTARDAAPDGVRSYAFSHDDGRDVRVMWTPEGTGQVSLRTDSDVVVTRMDGQNRTLSPYQGLVHLSLGEEPLYVAGEVDAVEAGSLVSLTAPENAPAGSDITVTAFVDGRGQKRATPAFVTVEGDRLKVVATPRRTAQDQTVVAAGEGIDTSPVEAQPEVRTRTVLGELRIAGRDAGWLAVEINLT